MSKSRRQQIMEMLETTLKAVPSLGGNVYSWKTDADDLIRTDKVPCLLFKDSGEEITASSISPKNGRQKHGLSIEFLLIATGTGADASVRGLLKDVYSAIGTDQTLGGLVDWVTSISDEMQVEQEAKTEAAIQIRMTFEYQTTAFDF